MTGFGLMLFLALPIALVQADGENVPSRDRELARSQNGQTVRPQERSTVRPHRTARPATPAADPFGLDRSRLGVIQGASDELNASPSPTRETRRKYERFIEGFVDADNTLDTIQGRPRILILKQPPLRIQIPNDDIARYDILTDRELSVTGLAVGTTLLNIWFADPNNPNGEQILSYLVRVLPDPEARQRLERDFEALERSLNGAFPDAMIHLSLVGNAILVEGQAKDSIQADKIMRVVARNAPRVAGTTPTPDAGASVGADDFEFSSSESGSDITTRRFEVINLLQIPGEAQVALSVTVAEVNRSAARSIGMDFEITNDAGDLIVGGLTGAATGGLATNIPIFLDNGQIAIQLEALRGLDFARSLAEPTLMTLNGESAQFSAGGEFPVPVVTGATATGLQGVEFVPFGVNLSFTPYILDRERIRLNVSGEVSTRSLSTGTTVGGSDVPGIDTRNFDTVVELLDGQTLAIAGLIQQNFGSTSDRTPGLGDLPFVGWMFGINRTSSSEQELIVVITPELVRPLDPDNVPNFLPGADMFEPDDIEFYLLNRLEGQHAADARPTVQTTPDRIGNQRDANRMFIVGPSGHADGR